MDEELRRLAKRANDQETLKELDAIPKLQTKQLFLFNAFFDLDTERSHGQALTKIPRSAMMAYASECGLNEDEALEFVYIMRQVDDAHLAELAKKTQRNGENS